MRGFVSGIFGGGSKKAEAQPTPDKEEKNTSQDAEQKPIEKQKEETSNQFTSSTGFNLPGVVNQGHVPPASTDEKPAETSQSQAPAGNSSNQLPGLFAGMTFQTETKPAADPQSVEVPKQGADEKAKEQSSSSLPGLFAGLDSMGTTQSKKEPDAKPVEPAQEAPKEEAVNPPQQSFDLFSQLNMMTSQAPQAQNTSTSSDQKNTIPQNPYSPGLDAKQGEPSSGLGTTPPGMQFSSQQPATQTNAFGLSMFSGLTPTQNTSTAQASSACNYESPVEIKPSNEPASGSGLPSAFGFMSGLGGPGSPPAQADKGIPATSTTQENVDSVDRQDSRQSVGLGIFAGMDLMAKTTNTNDDQIDKIGKSGDGLTSQPTEISIIDNLNGDNSKHQISFEEMNLNMVGASASGAADGNSSSNGVLVGMGSPDKGKDVQHTGHSEAKADQDKNYRPVDLLAIPTAANENQSQPSSDQPQRQSSMFAFMTVKQPSEGANLPHSSYKPDILPTHPSQIQPSGQMAAERRDNEPFNAQDISNEDLLMMPSAQIGDNLGNSFKSNGDNDDQENFEEILESREIIEDKIFAIKCRMIDFTVRQWDISDKINGLQSDIEILQSKVEDTQNEQAKAIESEDYEKADNLDMRIKQTKKLVEAKEYQIKQMCENKLSQEVMKADKHQELSELMHRSISKVDAIKEKQTLEMKQYEEAETAAIEEKKKRLHYESIRISEEKKTLEEEKSQVDEAIGAVDDKVYQDTKEQHAEKHKLDEMIDDLNREIEDIMRVLERKKKEKEMLQLEKQVHERKIEQARMIYKDDLTTMGAKQDKVNQKLTTNEKENQEWQQEKKDLDEYEEHFNAQIKNFQQEFKNLDEMKNYLELNSVEIDQCNKERKDIRNKQNGITSEIQHLTQEKKQIVQGREFIQERLSRLELELDEFETQMQSNIKKLTKLDLEKKKFAAAKKFKDAGKCQNEIKETQQQQEHCTQQIEKTQDHKQQIEQDLEAQNKQISEIETKLSEISIDNEKNQLMMLTYRKDEILDLIGSVNKVLAQIEVKGVEVFNKGTVGRPSGSTAKSKISPEDLTAKLEKLQNELTSIDEELFELEKKYGEYKRPVVEKQIPLEEVIEDKHASDEKKMEEEDPERREDPVDLAKEPQDQNEKVPVPTKGMSKVWGMYESEEIQEIKEPENDESSTPKLDNEALRKLISEYETKVKELEDAVDREAEAENYDEAERLQEELEKLLEESQPKIEQYKQQLAENAINNENEDKDNVEKEVAEEMKEEVDDNQDAAQKEIGSELKTEEPISESTPKQSMFQFMQTKEETKEDPIGNTEAQAEATEVADHQDTRVEDATEEVPEKESNQHPDRDEAKPSAFGFLAQSQAEQTAPEKEEDPSAKEGDLEPHPDSSFKKQVSATLSDANTHGADLQNTADLEYKFELQHQETLSRQKSGQAPFVAIVEQEKYQKQEDPDQQYLKAHSMTSELIQNLVDDPEPDMDEQCSKEIEIPLDTNEIDSSLQKPTPSMAENMDKHIKDDNTEEREAPQQENQAPSGFAFIQESASSKQPKEPEQQELQQQEKPEEPPETETKEKLEEHKDELKPVSAFGFSFMNSQQNVQNEGSNSQEQAELAENKQEESDQPNVSSGFGFMNNQ